MRLILLLISIMYLPTLKAYADTTNRSHGLSAFNTLKYGANFKHFDYVNPNAPIGGTFRLMGIDSFDNLNPFILKGVPPAGVGLVHATLMVRAMDEPDALYGLVAQTIEMPADRSEITFHLNPTAKFNNGSPITAEDVVFTYQTLVSKGHPQYRFIFSGVDKANILNRHSVRFIFKSANNRDLPLQVAAMPVLSKEYYNKNKFDNTTLKPPLGAGPYQITKVDAGRSITYRRIKNHWAERLPVMRGRYNFQKISVHYFRDRDVAFQAFFAGAYDFREEFTSRSWATQYDNKKPIKDKRIVRDTLLDARPSGLQAFFFNMRRNKFEDRRVRAALDYAFDFEWTNKTLFYNLYERTNSVFANSELAALKKPSPNEIKLLKTSGTKLPREVFLKPYRSPMTDGSGRNRQNLRKAMKMLQSAGWKIVNNKLVNEKGIPLTIEFLLYESTFQRILNPYVQNLKRIGVDAKIRIVDIANFQHRVQQYDFDVVIQRYVQPNTPGIEQKTYFSSEVANVPGSRNLAGIQNSAVDYLIEKVIAAEKRTELVTAVHALDRVLMWNHYMIPQWYKGVHNIAYWNKFERPKLKPKFSLGLLDTWWYNANKASMIEAGKAPLKQ